MHHLNHKHWLRTPNDDPRGYIEPQKLTELWFHTGTNCNLRCPFCLEGSKPGDNRIEFIRLDEVRSFIPAALALGVEKFSFTGGEPFINPDMVAILDLALDHRPCLVLTNATEPLMNRLGDVIRFKEKPHRLQFRVSLDHPDEKKHDAARGKGNFRNALRTLNRLHHHGFITSIARLIQPGEDREKTTRAYRDIFAQAGLPIDLNIVAFPDFHVPGSLPNIPHITENCMTKYLNTEQRESMMCNFSKMVVKKNGRIGVYACTLVDDDPEYDLGPTLSDAMKIRVMLKHHRCYSCFAFGASCSEG